MRRNETFALAIATGSTVVDAAERVGMSRATAFRLLHQAEVQAAIARARDEMFTRTVNQLADAALAGVNTLRAAMESGPPSVRVRAAEVLLALALRYRDHADTEERVDMLEEQMRRLLGAPT
jgi:phage terminase small subunit